MFDSLDRRSFLGNATLAAGATLVAPTPGTFSSLVTTRGTTSFEEIAAHFFYAEKERGPFVAKAASPWALILGLLGAGASIATIFTWLNVPPRWGVNLDVSDAGACTHNCQAQEAVMRSRDINIFSAVHRAPANRNLAIMVGQHRHSNQYNEAAVQYHGEEAFNLRGRETEAVRAATEYLGRNNRLTRGKLAEAVAVTGKKNLRLIHPQTGERVIARRFETALGGYILDNPSHPSHNGGVVAVHAPGLNDYEDPAPIGLRHAD